MSQMLAPLSNLAAEIMNGWKGRIRAVCVASPYQVSEGGERHPKQPPYQVRIALDWVDVPFMRELLRVSLPLFINLVFPDFISSLLIQFTYFIAGLRGSSRSFVVNPMSQTNRPVYVHSSLIFRAFPVTRRIQWIHPLICTFTGHPSLDS